MLIDKDVKAGKTAERVSVTSRKVAEQDSEQDSEQVMAPKPSFNFNPDLTKSSISLKLQSDAEFRKKAMVIIHGFQTTDEKINHKSIQQNRLGFMSSHASNGTRIAEKIIAKKKLTTEDKQLITEIAPKYTRQIAFYFREMESGNSNIII